MKKNRLILKLSELLTKSPKEREEILWGENSRRDFIRNASLASMGFFLGSKIAFADKMPLGYIPVSMYEGEEGKGFPAGKNKNLIVKTDKPWNVETPPHLLNDPITPFENMFMRNNGLIPESIDESTWTLTIDGESAVKPKTYSLAELKSKFKQYTRQVTLECAGNGRHEYNPPAKGVQWTTGAVYCVEWTGIRLKDVLNDAGIKSNAVYIGYYGKDKHLSRDPKKETISRGIPIEKAMKDEVLLAFGMNGEAIPRYHGAPLRLIVPGWPASTCGKWITRLAVRDKVHDGKKMLKSYRVPKNPVKPGENVADEDMAIIENMPVKSLITYPKTGAMLKMGKTLSLAGKAWAGEQSVREMHVSIDFGSTWQKCTIKPAPNMGAWQLWNTAVTFPKKGYYEVWAKATDENGESQPMVVPDWNPKGYLNNACHRIAIKVV